MCCTKFLCDQISVTIRNFKIGKLQGEIPNKKNPRTMTEMPPYQNKCSTLTKKATKNLRKLLQPYRPRIKILHSVIRRKTYWDHKIEMNQEGNTFWKCSDSSQILNTHQYSKVITSTVSRRLPGPVCYKRCEHSKVNSLLWTLITII